MAFLFKLFQQKPRAPERVATDTVIPLFRRDDSQMNRSIGIEFTMKFDEVLDAEKLSGALWSLIDRPGWRKLGARLRLDVLNLTPGARTYTEAGNRSTANLNTTYQCSSLKSVRRLLIRTIATTCLSRSTYLARNSLLRLASCRSSTRKLVRGF
jgi:hypothetical protein